MYPLLNKTLNQVALFTAMLIAASCSNFQNNDDTKDIAEEQNETNFDTNQQESDAQFLVNAAEINLEEIQLGKLAQEKGTTAHIKELGKMLEDAHTKSLNDLSALAQSKMISIPNASTQNAQDAYNSLNEKSGNDFDKSYADMMVDGHKDAIDTFEKASNNINDNEIKNWATASLTELRTHLEHSMECKKKSENSTTKGI